VAVNARGARVGKGGGYSDLEFALARAVGAVNARTTVVTTVHGLQVVKGDIPMTPHDVPVDVVVTPERVIRTQTAFAKPAGIRWKELSADQLDAMPVLRRLQLTRTARRR
jgi:5-formyltetrahydrofolate cyclo-ligase